MPKRKTPAPATPIRPLISDKEKYIRNAKKLFDDRRAAKKRRPEPVNNTNPEDSSPHSQRCLAN